MSAITAKASRKMKKYAVLTREPRCFLGSFDFSWEQRKLGDIASDMVAGGDIDKDLILAEGQYPVIANALTGDGIVGYYDKEYRVNAPAVTVTGRGDVGHAKARLVNFTPVVRLLSVKSEHDVFFLENAINTLKIVIESTGVPQLTVPQLAKYEVAFPRQLDEEEHIGVFFKQLDHLITLHQRECISFTARAGRLILTANKKRNTSSWEQRKVSDLAEKTYGGGTPTTSNEAYWNGDIPWIQSSDVVDGKLLGVEPRKWITQDGLNNSAAQLIPGNSIAIITRVGVGKLAFMPYSYATSQDFLSLSKLNAEPLFTVYACYKKLQSELNAVQGTSIKGITKDELLAKNIMVPRYAEQQQIGAFFKQLDNLITLHQRKGKAAVSGCSNDANNSKGVCCKARDFGYKCHKKDEPNRFDA